MSVKAVQQAIELIDKEGGGDFSGPRSASAIERAQDTLQVTFPPSYIEFLARLGVGIVEGFECFGLCNLDGTSAAGIPDVIGAARVESDESTYSRNFIFVSDDGMGGYYVIDRSVIDAEGESPVRVWERGPGLTEYVADSFGAFFLMEVARGYEEREEVAEWARG